MFNLNIVDSVMSLYSSNAFVNAQVQTAAVNVLINKMSQFNA